MRPRLGDRLAGQDIGFIAVCIYLAMVATSLALLGLVLSMRSRAATIALIAAYVLGWLGFVTYLGITGRRVSDRVSEGYIGVSAIIGTIALLCSLVCVLMGQGGVLTLVFWIDLAFFPAYLLVFYLLLLIKGRVHVQTLLIMVGLLGTALYSWMSGG